MNYLFILTLFILCACEKKNLLSGPSFTSDKIHLEYSTNIKTFEDEYSDIKKGIDDAQSRINDSSFTPKLAEIIKNEIFVQEKYLRLISQEISVLKLRDNERSKYYEQNSETLTNDQVKQDYESFKLSEKANPRKYIWRMRPGLILPPVDVKSAVKPAVKSSEKTTNGEAEPIADAPGGH